MPDKESGSWGTTGRNAGVAWLAACLLIGQFLYRLLVAAHEYPRLTERFMTIAFDILCLVGVVLLRRRLPQPVYWVAFIAGAGLFIIRMHSPESWATGHLSYYLLPR
jgi:hypothetical protein